TIDITLDNNDDIATTNEPVYFLGSLDPGATVSAQLIFNNPNRLRFDYTTSVYSQTPGQTDVTPPFLSISSPADGSLVTDLRQPIEVVYDDPSGVNLNSLHFTTNGVDLAVDCAAQDGVGLCTPLADYPEGAVSLVATITDLFGNIGTAQSQLTVVGSGGSALSVFVTEPVSGALFNRSPIAVTGAVSTDIVGVEVNGRPAAVSAGLFNLADLPLIEGKNTITVQATDSAGNTVVRIVQAVLDTDPPTVTVESPANGAVLTALQADIVGLVNDIVTGTTIDAEDCRVTVNGVEAEVSNRSWMVSDLLLQRGLNTLTVVATDRAGNSRTVTGTVTVQDQAGQRIVLLSGNNQSAQMGSQLPGPLVVTLLDAAGDPVANHPVDFRVSRGDGQVFSFPQQGSALTVNTDDNGLAKVLFTPGERIGAGNHRVLATAPGFIGEVEFCAMVAPGPARRIVVLSGDRQQSVAGGELAAPLVVFVTDAGGNPVAGVNVTFNVEQGGGLIQGSPSVTRSTDSDGLARAVLTLGANGSQLVRATFPGLTESAALFSADARTAGTAAATTVSGIVVDNQDNPVPGATAHLELEGAVLDPVPTAVTDAQGQFTIAGAPVGAVRLVVDGSTTSRSGHWPVLAFDLTAVAGLDNTVGMPIHLPQLADNEVLIATGGPEQDVILHIPGVEGTELTIAAHSVTCPNGQSECRISWTQVNNERVPMAPPLGSGFMLAGTLQPAATHFDPPAKICIPNSDMPPGMQVEIYSFDHDLDDFIAAGTATVSADGAQMCSDPGFGIVKAGWHGCVPPPPPSGDGSGDNGPDGPDGPGPGPDGDNDGQDSGPDGDGPDANNGDGDTPESQSDNSDVDDAADPVIAGTGEFKLSHVDLSIPGRGFPFELKRTYRSRYNFNGPLGYNWEFTY
ncbi:MAG: Ig-like domain-containing protein, partial [Gammaproteobacteria bacterium]